MQRPVQRPVHPAWSACAYSAPLKCKATHPASQSTARFVCALCCPTSCPRRRNVRCKPSRPVRRRARCASAAEQHRTLENPGRMQRKHAAYLYTTAGIVSFVLRCSEWRPAGRAQGRVSASVTGTIHTPAPCSALASMARRRRRRQPLPHAHQGVPFQHEQAHRQGRNRIHSFS